MEGQWNDKREHDHDFVRQQQQQQQTHPQSQQQQRGEPYPNSLSFFQDHLPTATNQHQEHNPIPIASPYPPQSSFFPESSIQPGGVPGQIQESLQASTSSSPINNFDFRSPLIVESSHQHQQIQQQHRHPQSTYQHAAAHPHQRSQYQPQYQSQQTQQQMHQQTHQQIHHSPRQQQVQSFHQTRNRSMSDYNPGMVIGGEDHLTHLNPSTIGSSALHPPIDRRNFVVGSEDTIHVGRHEGGGMIQPTGSNRDMNQLHPVPLRGPYSSIYPDMLPANIPSQSTNPSVYPQVQPLFSSATLSEHISPSQSSTHLGTSTVDSAAASSGSNGGNRELEMISNMMRVKTVKRCLACGTEQSPEWRKGPDGGKNLCNACGLRFSRNTKKQTKKDLNQKLADEIAANGGIIPKHVQERLEAEKDRKNEELQRKQKWKKR